MRGIPIALLGVCAVAPANTVSHPEDRAIYNVTRLIQYHSAQHEGWLPASWEQVRKEIPATAKLLDKDGHEIEERYGFVAPPLQFVESPGAPPGRLIGFSRWLEVKGPCYSERIERRLLLLDDKGNLRIPSLPERYVRQQLSSSGADASALLEKDQIFVQKRGIFSHPKARRNGVLVAIVLLLLGCGIGILRIPRGKRFN
jgi:hypothetical protein